MELYLHLKMCPPCKRYKKDSDVINVILKGKIKKMEKYAYSKTEIENIISTLKKSQL